MALLTLLVFPGFVWWAPGFLASRWALPRSTPLERLATGLVFGMALVVPTAFGLAFLARTPVTPATLIGISSAFSCLFGALLRWAPRPHDPGPPGLLVGQTVTVAALTVVLAAVLALIEAPRAVEATEVWAPCPHQSAFYLLEDGRGNGIDAWDAVWDQRVSHLVQHALEPGYGMGKVLTYQRVGSTATLVQPVAFFGSGGFVVATFIYYFIVLAFGTLLAGEKLRHRFTPLAIAFAFVVGARAVATYTVNENVLALGLSMATLWLARRTPNRLQGAFLGAVFALCLATRPMAIGLAPGLLWFLWPARRTAWTFVLAIPVALVAFLVAHHQLFGVAVTDPSLFQVRTPHTFLGVTFTFHPLIWPFSDGVVRSANEPFPLLFQLPLEHLRAFGGAFMALVVLGIILGGWRRAVPAVLWSLPGYALIAFIVSLDHHKQSYALTALGALPLLAGDGLSALLEWRGWRRVALIGGALSAVLGLPLLLAGAEFEVDPRRQYNDEVGRWDDPPVPEKEARLLAPTLHPRFDFDLPTTALALELLWHGRPPQRSADILESPVFVWKQLPEVTQTFMLAPTDAPGFPPYLGDLEGGLELTDSTAMLSLQVASQGPVQVTLRSDGRHVALEVVATGTGPARYVTVGYIDDGIEMVQEVRASLNGVAVPLRYHVLERDSQAPQLRIVANHPVHLVHVSHGPTLGFEYEAGEPDRRPCGQYTVGPYAFAMADDAVRVHAGPYDIRLRTVDTWPPPANRCEFTRVEGDSQ